LKKTNIIGSGGHCRSLIPLIRQNNLAISGIYDNSFAFAEQEIVLGIPIKGKADEIIKSEKEIVLAIGNNTLRETYFKKFEDRILKTNLIANSAIIEDYVVMGLSNQVFSMAFINAGTKIGSNNIINTKALIEHESNIGNHCHISIASVIGGRVKIGDRCFIGAGAIVKDQLEICNDVTIGAGAVVIKSISQPGTYIGNPIRKIK